MTSDTNPSKRKVLIIDDHPLVREWLTNFINQQEDLVVCGEAATAVETIQGLAACQPDVAVMDISLRDSSGIELIKQLKSSWPKLLVLVLSMHDESVYAERVLRAGAKGYIMKREVTSKILDALRTVLAGRFYISDNVSQAITTQFVVGTQVFHGHTDQLSDRELIVFEMLGEGRGTRQIAEALRVSVKTVQAYCARIKEKLNLTSATDLLREAVRHRQAKEIE